MISTITEEQESKLNVPGKLFFVCYSEYYLYWMQIRVEEKNVVAENGPLPVDSEMKKQQLH